MYYIRKLFNKNTLRIHHNEALDITAWVTASHIIFSRSMSTQVSGTSTYSTHHSETTDPKDNKHLVFMKRKINKWTRSEKINLLKKAHEYKTEYGIFNWNIISSYFPGRSKNSCYLKYYALAKSMRQGRSIIEDRINTSGESDFCKGIVQIITPNKNEKWTRKQDDMLMTMHELYGNNWSLLSELVGPYSPGQCEYRVKKLSLKSRLAAKQKDTKMGTKPALLDSQKPHSPDTINTTTIWTDAHKKKLSDLIRQNNNVFNFKLLHKHFPGLTYRQLLLRAQNLESGSDFISSRWTEEESKALISLAIKYESDWITISKNMPTKRSPAQCNARYFLISRSKFAHSTKKWTKNESDRLRDLVEMFKKGELPYPSFSIRNNRTKNDRNNILSQTGTTDDLQTEPEKTSSLAERLPSLSRVYAAMSEEEARLNQNSDTGINGKENEITDTITTPKTDNIYDKPKSSDKIDWILISHYMGTRSPTKCQSRWYRMAQLSNDKTCPWSLDEDVALYTSYCKTPNNWRSVESQISIPRNKLNIQSRYKKLGQYINMLRKLKGPTWDPLSDGFEDVHMRLELNYWYRGTDTGYRNSDSYKCPYDFDPNGYKAFIDGS